LTCSSDSLQNAGVPKTLTPQDRQRIAAKVGEIHASSILQAMTGARDLSPKECVRVERESGKELMRWDLRPKDWFLIWPELIGKKGAPAVPAEAGEKAEAR
jgi:DNA-binding transcriptional regulator YdaS (Cro superfamily)